MSTALVPLVPKSCGDAAVVQSAGRSNADFLAQLIATSTQAPQTRARRRAAPGEASAIYRMLNAAPPPVGRALSRSL